MQPRPQTTSNWGGKLQLASIQHAAEIVQRLTAEIEEAAQARHDTREAVRRHEEQGHSKAATQT
jgi:hypothetical protein